MSGIRFGGLDPSILRELSGVYKPFVKAFKELISNAYDADADEVVIEFSDDFSQVTVRDDGRGMTPFEFRNDFTRVGGSSRRTYGDKTENGRQRIGSKGIGFLAMARYCRRLEVESGAERPHRHTVTVQETPAKLDLATVLDVPIPYRLLQSRLKYELKGGSRKKKLSEGSDFQVDLRNNEIIILKPAGPVKISLSVNLQGIAFRAILDFDRLLLLADRADLEKLNDFASIEVFVCPQPFQGTRITAYELKSFVPDQFRAEARKGNVRNISSRSGLEQFLWSLSRCTPITFKEPRAGTASRPSQLLASSQSSLTRLEVSHAGQTLVLKYPIYPFEPDAQMLHPDMFIEIDINEKGLRANGFLAGYENVIFPAEYRGIAIRVRSVAIGNAGFLGVEHMLTGAQKAALSQITGEINVLEGLDAVDALNPGRETFYEENLQYRVLRQHLVGEGEQVGGYLGAAIAAVLKRSQVKAALKDLLSRAAARRRTLDDISSAVTHYIAQGEKTGSLLKKMLQSKRSQQNGLSTAAGFEVSIPARVGGLLLNRASNLPEAVITDFEADKVHLDLARQEWDWSLILFDQRFQVVGKKGHPHQPVAEIDFQSKQIFINWNHPAKTQMDERSFLRTALAWALAKEAAKSDPNRMMDLAINLFSFRMGEGDG